MPFRPPSTPTLGVSAAPRCPVAPWPRRHPCVSPPSLLTGFDCTSNVLAGKLYGIPVRGTIAHSFIMSFTSLEEVQPKVSVTVGRGLGWDALPVTMLPVPWRMPQGL